MQIKSLDNGWEIAVRIGSAERKLTGSYGETKNVQDCRISDRVENNSAARALPV